MPGTYISPAETGLYYLQSRYYNPELGRFVNADGQISAPGTAILGNNMYAYCFNNPVMGYDPTGCWSWGILADAVVTVVATVTAVVAGIKAGISTLCSTKSASKAVATGVSVAATSFGAVNNTANAVYYNNFSDGKSDIEKDSEKSSYVNSYVSRWERLDYTKQETGEKTYNYAAWSYQSEYSLHMYGWYATSWAYEQNIPVVSSWAEKFKKANVTPHARDSRDFVAGATIVWGLLGL